MEIDTTVTDGCTGIPNTIFGVDITDCCVEHDTVKPCCMSAFYRCLKWKLRRLTLSTSLAALITTGGTIGCWWKYPKFMWNKTFKD